VLYRWFLRPLLYLLPAETAHRLIVACLKLLAWLPGLLGLSRRLKTPRDPITRVHALGLDFPSPVGLAAGFDKDAEVFESLGALGFGFVEVGTITGEGQPGNPTPRLFRLPRDRALINRMGFNNHGAEHAASVLAQKRDRRTLLGVNIGKTKLVPADEAARDYDKSARLLGPYADYMVINVSSPNTPGLRDLQAVESLRPLIVTVRAALDAAVPDRRVPLLVKIAPDLTNDDVVAVADLALELGLDGLIATNTTISRSGLETPDDEVKRLGAGGLSGAPVKARSLEVLRILRARVGDRLLLVSAGGIESPEDAWERIAAGATLVQIYTGMIYEGPSLPSRITAGLAKRTRAAGLSTIQHAVGQTT
jgi:dihydroorotate dehydrogenase